MNELKAMNVCYDKDKNRVIINSDKNSPFPKGLTCYDVKAALSVFQDDTPVYIYQVLSETNTRNRYKDVQINSKERDCLMRNTECTGDFEVAASGCLISMADQIRKEKGYTDLASDSDNEVWYNFYLAFTDEDIQLTFTCNNGEKDDWVTYQLPMTDYEKLCMWKRLPRFFFEVMNNIM